MWTLKQCIVFLVFIVIIGVIFISLNSFFSYLEFSRISFIIGNMVFAFMITIIAAVINSGDVSREEEEYSRIAENRAHARAEEALSNIND